MVKARNNTLTSIEIDHEGTHTTVQPNSYYDIPCKDSVGCAEWTIYKEGKVHWNGKVPCKINGIIDIGNVVSFDETVLPSVSSSGGGMSMSRWLIYIILFGLLALVCYF